MKELLLIKRINCKENKWDYNPVCHDDKIHIRLKHFNSNKMIIGFEDKLTFLLVFLLKNYLKSLQGKPEYEVDMRIKGHSGDIFSKYVGKFKSTDEFRILLEILSNKFIDCRDVRITEVYTRKSQLTLDDLFGHINSTLVSNETNINNLSSFTKALDISLQDYLFNDDFILLISNFKFKNPNTKFENKVTRKVEKRLKNKIENTDLEENKLW